MKRKFLLPLFAVMIAIGGAFATHVTKPVFALKAMPAGTCVDAEDLTAPEGKTCQVQTSGSPCTVTVGATSGLQAYDGSCISTQTIKYN